MPHLLFRLNNVPEDEADDVRRLLTESRIDFYETEAGRWGISLAAIWLKEDGELERAKALIDAYQEERGARARARYAEQRRAGTHETLLARVVRHPVRTLLYLAAIAAILYITLMPFFDWRAA